MIERYGIDPEKVTVVHNAVTRREASGIYVLKRTPSRKCSVSGQNYLSERAGLLYRGSRKSFAGNAEVTFIMAGAGDMMPRMVERVAELGSAAGFTLRAS